MEGGSYVNLWDLGWDVFQSRVYSYFVDKFVVMNTSLSFQFELSKPEIFDDKYNPENINVQHSKRDPEVAVPIQTKWNSCTKFLTAFLLRKPLAKTKRGLLECLTF